MREWLIDVRKYLLNGVSFAIPFIACGGIMIAVALAFAPMVPGKGPVLDGHPILKLILDIGVASFTLMPPVLAGYIAYAIAQKPGLAPGMIGGWLATHLGTTMVNGEVKDVTAGFLGAMIAGLIAGYAAKFVKGWPVPKFIKPIMPILIIPIVASTIVGVVMLKVIGVPIAEVMTALGTWLASMGSGNAIVLAMILGAMIAFDMGGPINKVAFFFASALITDKDHPNIAVMGAVAAAICTPPLGLGLATIIRRKIWTEDEREAGTAAFAMGMIGITEGAIPFAAGDPLRVIPCIMVGSMVSSTIAMLAGVGDHAPHGGPIVLPVVEHKMMYVVAIACGVVVTAVLVNLVKIMTGKKAEAESGASAVAA